MKESYFLIQSVIDFFSADRHSRNFKKWLKSKARNKKRNFNGSAKILVESNQTAENMIALSYFLPILAEKYSSTILAYRFAKTRKRNRLRHYIRHRFSVLNAIGASELLSLNYSVSHRCDIHDDIVTRLVGLASPDNVINFEYRGVLIGDLLYDSYLNQNKRGTIDFQDENFRIEILTFLQISDQLHEFFSKNTVSAVCIGHWVYKMGLTARIGFAYDIPAFQVQNSLLCRLSRQSPYPLGAKNSFGHQMKSRTELERVQLKDLAKKRLNLRFSGQIGIDMPYSLKSSYLRNFSSNKIVRNPNKINVLIATHDFYDAPHLYGKFLYPDMEIWLERLHELSLKTNFDWYIKSHPDLRSEESLILNELLVRCPNFRYVPNTTSHHQLISEGITHALTVYGTIALEYPFLGIPVVNAAPNGPYSTMSFCNTPMTVNEYEDTILNLGSVQKPSERDIDQLLESYADRFLVRPTSWVFKSYEKFIRDSGDYLTAMSNKTYQYFLDTTNKFSDSEIENWLSKYLESGKDFIDWPREL